MHLSHWSDLEEPYVAQVCPSSPGVYVRRWFGVGALAWCECFLGSCVLSLGVGALAWRECPLDWWTYQRLCASAGAKVNTAES